VNREYYLVTARESTSSEKVSYMMKNVKIKTEKDLEDLPEDEVVEVESCDVGFRLVERGNLHTEVSISEEEVKIPLPEEHIRKWEWSKILKLRESPGK